MSLIGLALAASLSWVPLGDKQALVCELPTPKQAEICLQTLPKEAQVELGLSSHALAQQLGRRSAVALPINHGSIAGIVLLNSAQTPKVQTAAWDGEVYQLDLEQQTKLTYWHELGHLHLSEFEAEHSNTNFTPYEHEAFADVYLVWRLAREQKGIDLAWQQYHRRNLALLDNQLNMSHWSPLILQHLLIKYDWQQLASFTSFDVFLMDFLSKVLRPTQDELREYASLVKRTFGSGVTQPLPGYMFWRKEGLSQVLLPTFERMMGKKAAQDWLKQNLMLTISNEKIPSKAFLAEP